MKKRILALFLSAALSVAAAPAVFAEQSSVIQTETPKPLSMRNWTGGAIAKGCAFFITENATLKRTMTVPEGAMLVVGEGLLTIPKETTLIVKGALVVHEGAKLNCKKGGRLEIAETGVVVSNGKLAISKGGSVANSGFLQAQGAVNVKGEITTAEGAVFSSLSKPVIKGGSVIGGCTLTPQSEMRYFADKLNWKRNEILVTDNTDNGKTRLLDGKHITNFENAFITAKFFEGILYKLDSEADAAAQTEPVLTAQIVGKTGSGNCCGVNAQGKTIVQLEDGTELVYKPVLGAMDVQKLILCLDEPCCYDNKFDAYVSKDGTEYYISDGPYLFCRDSEGKAHNIGYYSPDKYYQRCVNSLDKLTLIDSNVTIDAALECAEYDIIFDAEEVYLTKTGKLAVVARTKDFSVFDWYGEDFSVYAPITKQQFTNAAEKYGEDSFYTIYIMSPSRF